MSLTAGLATSACAQPAPDQPPPGYGGPPPGYSGAQPGYGGQQQPGYGAPPPGYQGPPPGDMNAPPAGPPGAMSGQAGAPHGPRARFEAANVTHDGRLTLQQAEAAGWQGVAKHFGEIDRDNKGYITMQDLHAWNMARHAARAGGMQGPPPGGGMQAPPPSMQGPPPGQQY